MTISEMLGFCFGIIIACFLAFAIVSCIYYFLIKDILKNVRIFMRARRIKKLAKKIKIEVFKG